MVEVRAGICEAANIRKTREKGGAGRVIRLLRLEAIVTITEGDGHPWGRSAVFLPNCGHEFRQNFVRRPGSASHDSICCRILADVHKNQFSAIRPELVFPQ